jgi:hypothetical protein
VTADPIETLAPHKSVHPSLVQCLWLLGVTLLTSGLVLLTLHEIQSVALNNHPSSEAKAACIANRDPNSTKSVTVDCPDHSRVIFAAQNPVRNTVIVFVLLLVGGYLYLMFHRSRWGWSFGQRVPPASP